MRPDFDDITPRMRLRLARKNLFRPRKRLAMEKDGNSIRVEIGGERIYIAAANRWSRYFKGVGKQLDSIAQQYRLYDVAPVFAGRTVIDIGANIGEFSMFAARRGARVIAIEPDRPVYDVLLRNAGGYDIRTYCELLWHEPAELTFYSSTANADSSVFRPHEVEGTDKRLARPLDDVVPDDVDEIVAIKADAEGAEPEVLMGAVRTLARTRYIALDCGAERLGQETVEDCTRILEGYGFDVGVSRDYRTMVLGLRRRASA